MGKLFSIEQGTAWYFIQKVGKSMKSSQKYSLEKLIHIDKFTVEGKQGRSYDSKKKKAVIAVKQTDNNKVKRVDISSIDDYSAKSLTSIFEQQITSAKIIADKCRGYEPLKEIYNIE